MIRLASKGCYGVRLKTVRYGGKRLTRKVWIDEFNKKVLESSPSFQMDTDPVKTAAAKLNSMGIK
ncbi:MAG TPA: hypothetical protein DHW22_05610 [Planctomycetaceae bacterium]|nr:hypothetical protein [Planctomycetaceae bacterium]